MSNTLDKLNANAKDLAVELEKRVEQLAGRKLKFTLLVWGDEPWSSTDKDRYGLTYTHISSLPGVLLPDCLRLVADRFDAKKPTKQ